MITNDARDRPFLARMFVVGRRLDLFLNRTGKTLYVRKPRILRHETQRSDSPYIVLSVNNSIYIYVGERWLHDNLTDAEWADYTCALLMDKVIRTKYRFASPIEGKI